MSGNFRTQTGRVGLAAACCAGLAFLLSTVGNIGSAGRAAAETYCNSDGIPIWITVDNVRSSRGTIKVELYVDKDKKKFTKAKKVARTRVKARAGETNLCLSAPSAGAYAIALYHDENDNRKLDTNFIGIPREGFGFSNNPPIRLGLPGNDEVRFRVEHLATSLRISVVYL